MHNNSSLLSKLVQTALAILFAAFALHLAAQLLLEVWPVLIAGAVLVVLTRFCWVRWGGQDRW